MKSLIFAIAMTLTTASVSHAKKLTCHSFEALEGWTGSRTYKTATFNATVTSNDYLEQAQITGAFLASAITSAPDTQFTSKNPRYQNYTRYSALEDAWCWYTPFFPKNLATFNSGTDFTGFVNRSCENRSSSNIAMKCVIE